ncbi:alpha-acetolactate decarboxylase [soil metagenome]
MIPRPGKAIQQFSFVDALVAGLLDGAFPASRVRGAGDLGVGCGDALDGELLLLDGVLYLCRGDGQVIAVDDDALLPFAEVVHFEPTHTMTLDGPLDEKSLELLIEQLVPSDNLFYALRVEGVFDRMTVREAVRQQKPYQGLADAVKQQRESTVGPTTGTMIGFKGPDVFQGLSVADFHLHYLDTEHGFGGHVLDFSLASGTLAIEAYASFTVHLPEVQSYLDADLDDIDADEAIRQAEGS